MKLKKPKSICFVDDDPEEVRRFRDNLKARYRVGAGTSIDQAFEDLKKNGGKRPKLFLFDLYYPTGPLSTKTELEELAHARQEFLKAEARFREVLCKLRQSSDGGFRLARIVRKRRIPFAFFTRKGTLEDAIAAYEGGALSVIKKPDPNEDQNKLENPLDLAFSSNVDNLNRAIEEALTRTTLWWKYKKVIVGIVIGLLANYIYSIAGSLTHWILRFVAGNGK
jgi:DNA-binding NtrC family response regulator